MDDLKFDDLPVGAQMAGILGIVIIILLLFGAGLGIYGTYEYFFHPEMPKQIERRVLGISLFLAVLCISILCIGGYFCWKECIKK